MGQFLILFEAVESLVQGSKRHRPSRDSDGWKYSTKEWLVYRETIRVNEEDVTAPPDMVKDVKRFS
eukprot:4692012-Ditylum_brightwellii.AAC.1